MVTGASRGIGEGILRLLVKEGATVIGAFNTGQEEADKLQEELGQRVRMLHVDLANTSSLRSFAAKVKETGRIDGLVNNAGAIDFQMWKDFSVEEWRGTFAVNVDAAVALTHALYENMNTGGSVVNIASTDGFTGSFGSIAYSASKAALVNVTKSLGNLLAPAGIRVNAVCPGWIDTGMSTDASYAAAGNTPLGRNGTPEDVARTVAFFLGPDSGYVTGSALVVDGGYTNVDVIMRQEYVDLENESSAPGAPE
ncbi:SDR family oxidoreductase [Plantactinospora veratri]